LPSSSSAPASAGRSAPSPTTTSGALDRHPAQDDLDIVWSVAGIVAIVAGIMWGAKSGVQFSLSLIALKSLPVLILGGFTSVPGAIVGG